jgi:hypothetical protein
MPGPVPTGLATETGAIGAGTELAGANDALGAGTGDNGRFVAEDPLFAEATVAPQGCGLPGLGWKCVPAVPAAAAAGLSHRKLASAAPASSEEAPVGQVLPAPYSAALVCGFTTMTGGFVCVPPAPAE